MISNFLMPFFLLSLLILSLPFGQLTRVTFLRPEIHFYLHDLIIILLVIYGLFKKRADLKKLFKNPLAHLILAFFLVAGFSLLLNSFQYLAGEVLVSALYLVRWLAYALVFLLASDLFIRKPETKPKFYKLLIYSSLILAIFGFLQYFLYPDFRIFEIYDWDPHYYRLLSTLFDPGFTGMMLVLSLILLVSYYWKSFQKPDTKAIVPYLIFLLFYLALALTYSRSAYLAYLVGFLVISLRKKAPRLFFTLLFLGVVTVLVLPRPGGEGVKLERTTSSLARVNNWVQGWEIIKKNPLFGVGFNTLRYVQKDYGLLEGDWQKTHAGAGLDSSPLFILATTGLVGFFVFLYFLRTIFSFKSLVIEASLLSLIAHSLFNNTLFYPWVMIWFWLVLALETSGSRRP